MWLFYYFNFEWNYDVFKLKSTCIFWNKNKNLIKTKWYGKWKIPHTVLERQTLCFSSYKNRQLKVKLWWVVARERKTRAFCPKKILLTFVFYLNVRCIECTLRIYILLQIKKHFSYTFLLVFKIVEKDLVYP